MLGKRNIACVITGKLVPQLPNPLRKRCRLKTLNVKSIEIINRALRLNIV